MAVEARPGFVLEKVPRVARYKHGTQGKWIQCALPPHRNKFACCGCGMTHEHEYKIIPTTRGPKRLTLWTRIRLDKRATARIRKHQKELHESEIFYIAIFPKKGKHAPWALIPDDVSGLGDELKLASKLKASRGTSRFGKKSRSRSARSSRAKVGKSRLVGTR